MGPGGIFGNIRGATKYMTMSNVIASRNIDLLCIKGRDFYALLKVLASNATMMQCLLVDMHRIKILLMSKLLCLQSYPSVLQKVKESVETAVKDYVLPTIVSARNSSTEVTNVCHRNTCRNSTSANIQTSIQFTIHQVTNFPLSYETGEEEADEFEIDPELYMEVNYFLISKVKLKGLGLTYDTKQQLTRTRKCFPM